MTITERLSAPRRSTAAAADQRTPSDHSARRSALVAGRGLLALTVLAVLGNFGVVQRLVTDGDATRTANDILAAEATFVLGITALFVVVMLDIVVAKALRTFFAPAHRRLAAVAAWLRISYAAIFAVAIGQLFAALSVLHNARHITGSAVDQRDAQALLKIEAFEDIWRVSLVLFGLHLMLIGYLAYRSRYALRAIGVLMVIAGVGYLIDSFGGIMADSYSVNVSGVTFIGEAVFMGWLLLKGRRITAV
ncbi:MAG: hypothetical protein JWM93_1224 [Frankiales bacterium]|nr:hypothetical protein [Frankiales bacterium]